jgi:hypothetical protein
MDEYRHGAHLVFLIACFRGKNRLEPESPALAVIQGQRLPAVEFSGIVAKVSAFSFDQFNQYLILFQLIKIKIDWQAQFVTAQFVTRRPACAV